MLASLLEQPLLPILVILAITLFLCLHSQVTEFRAKQAGLLGSLLALFVAVLGCISFDKSTASFQYLARATFDSTYNLYFTLGADGLSMVFLILTLFVFPLLVLASWSGVRKARVFISYLVGMELLLVLTFTTTDLFSFYVLFESLLIPMFILIGV